MALPQMTTPFYKVQIPSTGQEITFRPFLVREEKALLLSQQSEDTDVMINTLKEVLTGCIKEPINPDNLAIFDVEYFYSNPFDLRLLTIDYLCQGNSLFKWFKALKNVRN